MRIPRGHRVAGLFRMERAERVNVAFLEHRFHRSPADATTGRPQQRAQSQRQPPRLERRARRQCIEIAGEHVECRFVPPHAAQECPQFEDPPALGPRRVDGAQVDAEDAERLARPARSRRRRDGRNAGDAMTRAPPVHGSCTRATAARLRATPPSPTLVRSARLRRAASLPEAARDRGGTPGSRGPAYRPGLARRARCCM